MMGASNPGGPEPSHDGPAQLALIPLDDAKSDPAWWFTARQAIEHLAATGEPFGADELRDPPLNVGDPAHPNHWGIAFGAALRAGVIRPTGRVATSRRRSRSRGYCRVWIGTDLAIPSAA